MNTNFQARIPIIPGTMQSLRYADDVNLSPDGQRVAFEVSDWATGQRKRRSTIWVVETSAGEPGNQKPLSKSGRQDSCRAGHQIVHNWLLSLKKRVMKVRINPSCI